MKRRLTTVYLDKLNPPATGQADHYDSDITGFGVRVTYKGRRTFFYWYRFNGRPRRMTLGRYPQMTLAEARQDAREAYLLLTKGVDPIAERESREQALERDKGRTFVALWETFWNDHESKKRDHRNTATIAKAHILPHWGDRHIESINRADVRKLVRTPETPGAQNNVFKTVRRIFAWAVNEGLMETSPCFGLKMPHAQVPRTGYLETDDQLRAFWRICVEWGYPNGHAGRLLLLTGQRAEQVRGAEKAELDYDALTWTIPGKRVKRTRAGQAVLPHSVPLTPLAVEIFREASDYATGKHVFQSRKNRRQAVGTMQKLSEAVKKEVPGFMIHNLRRTVASIMNQRLNAPESIIEQILNHKPQSVTGRHYAHGHNEAAKRAALEAWDGYLKEVLK